METGAIKCAAQWSFTEGMAQGSSSGPCKLLARLLHATSMNEKRGCIGGLLLAPAHLLTCELCSPRCRPRPRVDICEAASEKAILPLPLAGWWHQGGP